MPLFFCLLKDISHISKNIIPKLTTKDRLALFKAKFPLTGLRVTKIVGDAKEWLETTFMPNLKELAGIMLIDF